MSRNYWYMIGAVIVIYVFVRWQSLRKAGWDADWTTFKTAANPFKYGWDLKPGM